MIRIKILQPGLMTLTVAFAAINFFSISTHAQTQGVDPQSSDWKRANEQVGKFLRGHADIVKHEARSAPSLSQDSKLNRGQLLSVEQAKRLALQARPNLFSEGGKSFTESYAQSSNVIGLLSDIDRAWNQAVGMLLVLNLQKDSNEAAQIGKELARRMGKVGNWGADKVIAAAMLAQSEELKLIQTQQEADRARQTLASLVMTDEFELPQRLPEIKGIGASQDLNMSPKQLASERLLREPDYKTKKSTLRRLEDAAGSKALKDWSTFSYEKVESVLQGASPLTLSIDRSAILWTHNIKEAILKRQELTMHEQETINIIHSAQSEVKSRHAKAMLLKNEYLPLAKQAEEEAIYQYNGMFISTWALLEKFRSRVDVEITSTQAQMQFWDAYYAYQAYMAGSTYKPPSGIGLSSAAESGNVSGGH